MSIKSSDSSKELRERLKQLALGSIPPILNSNHIDIYYKFTKETYLQALKQFQDNNLEQAYICYYMVAQLSIKQIPTHNGYNIIQNQSNKLWSKKIAQESMETIEKIVILLDKMIDDKIIEENKLNLINEFDDLNGENDDLPVYLANKSLFNNDSYKSNDHYNIGKSIDNVTDLVINESSASDVNNKLIKSNLSSYDKSKYFNLLKPKDIIDDSIPFKSHKDDSRFDHSVDNEKNKTLSNHVEEKIIKQNDEIIQLAKSTKKYTIYLSENIKKILKYISNPQQLHEPIPSSTRITIKVGQSNFMFCQDDFHVSFLNFLRFLPAQLQNLPLVLETNRCFFIHLGVATMIHPFVLQTAYRIQTSIIIQNESPDSLITELLQSILQPTAFIDFNSLLFLWPLEFNTTRICLISGSFTNPVISTFQPKDINVLTAREVILRCDGSHFTLLRPFLSNHEASNRSAFLPKLFAVATRYGIPIHEHFVPDNSYNFSILETFKLAKSQT